jgi:cytochrome c556
MSFRRVAVAVTTLGVAISVADAQVRPMQPDKDGFIPDVTVAEIMESIVMPAAQAVWDAVGVDVTDKGEIEKKPETEEQWAQLRAAAVALVESTNSLTVPGRHAAPPGTKSENPDAELTPEKIDALLAQQRPAWVAHAQVLHAAALQALAAVDTRNLDAITEAGGTIDEACESCHLQFWYPEQQR